MRTLVASLMVSAASLIAVSAQAADAVTQVPQAPAAYDAPAPAATWSGFYLGGNGAYDWGKVKGDSTKPSADGWGGGIYGGYNWQSGQIVYGAEADLGYNDQKGSANGVTTEEKLNGSVRGRVGYDLNPFMIYGTAGLAVGNHEVSSAAGSDSKTSVGYTVGAGVEAFVTSNITARLEYRYTDYNDKNYNLGGTNVSRGFDDQSVKVGIGVKF
ncbi:outer membrane immunogenic protein [Rhizobium sp. RU35A]|uniref:Porin family protein n=1 Tax=Rhizobium straminoryzae TaxID=1387186 RepID=A0A549T9M1_9HYPH|nr:MULTISPECIES: outer membrane protein [Rhizobium]TRL38571.1 porin family protein [Rhizobium straminoryzae]SIP91430.1 outer membrane immunogenic protein [Rhizobium sp. RU35A]